MASSRTLSLKGIPARLRPDVTDATSWAAPSGLTFQYTRTSVAAPSQTRASSLTIE
jgi:hypothetical protein